MKIEDKEIYIPHMVTIKEAAELMKDRGISETFIRKGVRTGKIIFVKSGRKTLINLDKFIEYLNEGGG